MSYSPHAHTTTDPPVSAPSLSSRDHHPRRVVVLSCLPELLGCRSTDGRTWGHPDLRSRAVLVSDVRASLCPSPPTPAFPPRRHVALRRGVPHDQGHAARSMAGGRSGGPPP